MAKMLELQGYASARETMREQRILDHMHLVKRIAAAFAARTPRHIEAADLAGAGTLGLIHAVDQFDPKRNVAFEAFAVFCIRRAILDHLRNLDPLPSSMRARVRRIERAMVALQKQLGRMPSSVEIAASTGLHEKDIERAMSEAAASALYSAEEIDECTGAALGVAGGDAPDALAALEHQQAVELLVRLLQQLPNQERLVLTLIYYEGLKQRQVAAVLNLSESRVSQIRSRALTLLRGQLRESFDERE